MNKERLRKIKRELELGWSDVSRVVMSQDDVKWLISRIEELEQEVNNWRDEATKWSIRFQESEESHSETKELLHSIISKIIAN